MIRTLFIALVLSTSSAIAADNLVKNPGFEDGMPPWAENNWQKNDVQYLRDTANPHSGSYAMQIHFVKTINGPYANLLYSNLPVLGGQTLKVSYWARGISNGPPLGLSIRRGAPTYKPYAHFDAIPTEQWQEFSTTVTLPDQIDPGTQLLFELRNPGIFWIDDVSITEMPSVEGGEPPASNPIRNASFEVGRDGWTATFHDREFGTQEEESGSNGPSPDDARLDAVDVPDAPQGRRCLQFDVVPKSFAKVTSAYFPARYGHLLEIKFSLKADAAKEFKFKLISGKNANIHIDGGAVLKATDKWQSYTVPVTPRAAPGGLYCLQFEFNVPGKFSIDDVTITEKGAPPVPTSTFAVALDPAPDAPAGNLYAKGQKAALRLCVANGKPDSTSSFEFTVTDFLGRETSHNKLGLGLDKEGYGEIAVPVFTGTYGAFHVAVRQKDTLLAEQIYSVLPDLPPPAERPDSFFGGHVDLTPYNLEIARKAGFRWLRLYPPLFMQWMAAEPSPGVWNLPTEKVARAKKFGFQILGNLGTTPNVAADSDPKDFAISRWINSYPPKDMAAWKDYVTRCVTTYSPWIDTWEVWNEPDGGYLRVRPGQDKAQVYVELLKSAREAIDAAAADSKKKPVTLMGPALAGINAPLGWQILDQGGGKYLDAFSFHYYSLAAGGANPDTAFTTPILQKYASYKNKDGQPMPLWHTEGGIYLAGSQSWLQTYRIPPSSTVTPPEAAASMVRAAIFLKASGVKRYFDYQVGASAAGRRTPEDITCGFIDVTGIPAPGIAAHAAMVWLVEDATPLGFDEPTDPAIGLKTAHFKSPKGNIDVYWSDKSTPLQDIAKLQPADELRDMMGNPLDPATAQTSQFPLYVLRASAPR